MGGGGGGGTVKPQFIQCHTQVIYTMSYTSISTLRECIGYYAMSIYYTACMYLQLDSHLSPQEFLGVSRMDSSKALTHSDQVYYTDPAYDFWGPAGDSTHLVHCKGRPRG